ncbi:MAG TPA: hypothetical protein VHQ99_00715 [Gaiellaceae bacterium]|jgi:hypothetical protein|nr:hypothetical protein [Gaiellaceae bacterium]
MRKLLLLATAETLAVLVATAPAAAKGPSIASLSGPGLDRAVPIKGEGESGPGTPLGSLVELGGFFPQVFLQVPDPTRRARPAGNLGPRYRITYRVPGPHGTGTLVQDVYPYANTPVTYMSPDQRFWGVNRTHGGWFVAGPGLKVTLVAAGLPESPPAESDGSFLWGWTIVGVGAVAVLLVLVLRRRDVARLRTLKTAA